MEQEARVLYNDRPALEWSFDLQLSWCVRNRLTPDWAHPPQLLLADVMEFVFAEKHAFWCVVNGKRLVIRPGDLLILRGGDTFSWGGFPGTPNVLMITCLKLHQKHCGNLLVRCAFAHRYPLSNPRGYMACFRAIQTAMRTSPAHQPIAVTAAVFEWLHFVMQATRVSILPAPASNPRAVQKILEAQAWVESRLGEPVTLADWAKTTGWNDGHFSRVFKLETTYRPMKWLQQRRMEVASELLLGTDRPVSQIAEAVGYLDSFYFSQVFKKHYGKAPLRYRKTGSSAPPGHA